jgi:hypothetical protein
MRIEKARSGRMDRDRFGPGDDRGLGSIPESDCSVPGGLEKAIEDLSTQ